MADSNSQPARCPCGFWGSPQTLGLCSKCFREREKKDTSPAAAPSAGTTNGTGIETKAIQQAIAAIPPLNETTTPASDDKKDSPIEESATEERHEESTDNKDESSKTEKPKEPSPGSKRDASEVESEEIDPDRPVQKNKKRCFTCNCKLELAIREIGKCRCNYVFCQMHRLPEQHDCIFDHKLKGREEARNKMVSPKKHMGTSLRRIDSDS